MKATATFHLWASGESSPCAAAGCPGEDFRAHREGGAAELRELEARVTAAELKLELRDSKVRELEARDAARAREFEARDAARAREFEARDAARVRAFKERDEKARETVAITLAEYRRLWARNEMGQILADVARQKLTSHVALLQHELGTRDAAMRELVARGCVGGSSGTSEDDSADGDFGPARKGVPALLAERGAASLRARLTARTLEDLRVLCAAHGLSQAGRKTVIVGRLARAAADPAELELMACSREQLRAACADRGLDTSGTKGALALRLLQS
jgi:hypothetical protein